MSIQELPNEILTRETLFTLPVKSVLEFCRTSTRYRSLCQREDFWLNYFRNRRDTPALIREIIDSDSVSLLKTLEKTGVRFDINKWLSVLIKAEAYSIIEAYYSKYNPQNLGHHLGLLFNRAKPLPMSQASLVKLATIITSHHTELSSGVLGLLIEIYFHHPKILGYYFAAYMIGHPEFYFLILSLLVDSGRSRDIEAYNLLLQYILNHSGEIDPFPQVRDGQEVESPLWPLRERHLNSLTLPYIINFFQKFPLELVNLRTNTDLNFRNLYQIANDEQRVQLINLLEEYLNRVEAYLDSVSDPEEMEQYRRDFYDFFLNEIDFFRGILPPRILQRIID